MALVVGSAVTALVPGQQHILNILENPSQTLTDSLHDQDEKLKTLTKEARELWDEVAMLFPESFNKASFFSPPKPHEPKKDSEWDFITKGANIIDGFVEPSDQSLRPYSLRTKVVDPSSLGVDSVKQYSGYLDDKENDKHLFYCKSHTNYRLLLSYPN